MTHTTEHKNALTATSKGHTATQLIMKIRSISFAGSSTTCSECPNDQKPEVAFVGRSNVGKSSLINALLQRKQLAKVSKIPGKTQLINHFLINEQFYFVDLPGYGWAQVSHEKKIKWEKMLRAYLLHRKQLINIFVLIDSKISPQSIDLDLIDWLETYEIPFTIIFTKSDKKNKLVTQTHRKAFVQHFTGRATPPLFSVSSHDKTGLEAILGYIQSLLIKEAKAAVHRL